MSEAQRQFRLKVIVAFAMVYILWGSTYLAIGVAVDHVSPPMMGAARFITAGALMLLWRKLSGSSIAVSARELLRLTIIGTLLLVTSNVVLGWAEQMIPTGLAALLIAITPLWFLLLERLSRKGEHFSGRAVVGIVFGVAGVAVLMWPKLRLGTSFGHREVFGMALVLTASFSWASGSILSKRWHVGVDAYGASGWEMLMAGIVNLLVGASLGELPRTHWDRDAVLAISYLVIAGSWAGFTAYIWLLKNVPTSKVATYAYVNPIVAVFLGWLFRNETIDKWMLGGSAIIIASVILVTGARPRRPRELGVELPAVESTGD
ncbi:MAG: EamA family transporter [Terriglobia bacterium]|jgi:drug/metabolite transporter (DMT)-like permease|nr:EamA family transporter [Terriglobia bacterium]